MTIVTVVYDQGFMNAANTVFFEARLQACFLHYGQVNMTTSYALMYIYNIIIFARLSEKGFRTRLYWPSGMKTRRSQTILGRYISVAKRRKKDREK